MLSGYQMDFWTYWDTKDKLQLFLPNISCFVPIWNTDVEKRVSFINGQLRAAVPPNKTLTYGDSRNKCTEENEKKYKCILNRNTMLWHFTNIINWQCPESDKLSSTNMGRKPLSHGFLWVLYKIRLEILHYKNGKSKVQSKFQKNHMFKALWIWQQIRFFSYIFFSSSLMAK